MKEKKKSTTQQITVKVNEENPEPLELIAKAIIKIETSPLRRNTIVLLLKDATGLAQRDINKILDAAPKLRNYYVKEIKK